MNDNRFLQKYGYDEAEEEDEYFGEIEFIYDTPVISLEDALILYNKVLEFFPRWKYLLSLPTDARVDSRRQQFVDQISKISSCLDCKYAGLRKRGRRRCKEKKMKLPDKCDFGFWDVPVPELEELRSSFPESEFYRYMLEMELSVTRMDVRETLQPILSLLSGSIEVGPYSESLLDFKKNFFSAMQKLGVYLEN